VALRIQFVPIVLLGASGLYAARAKPIILHNLQAQTGQKTSVADGLRTELDQARKSAEERVAAVQNSNAAVIRQLHADLDVAQASLRAADAAIAAKDDLIVQLRGDVDRAAAIESKAIAATATVAQKAVVVEKMAAKRHAETIKGISETENGLRNLADLVQGLHRLVKTGDDAAAERDERLDREASDRRNMQRLEVIGACGGIAGLGMLALILTLLIRSRWGSK